MILGQRVKGQNHVWHFVHKALLTQYKLRIFKLHMLVVDDNRRNLIDFESKGQRSRSTLAICFQNLMDTKQTKVFTQSLSNFTCKLFMMR